MNRYNPIGVFDSGVGGLTVVKQISSYLPNENIIYFGDTARVPYGSKSNSTVIEYANENAKFLIRKNIKVLVVACNTASSVALDNLRENLDIQIIGMIQPGAETALQKTKNKKIGVIGTYATINNKAYSKELYKFTDELKVYEKACSLFVPLAEEGLINHPATKLIAEEYLKELREKEIDTLILGCTHYPILAEIIQEVIGENVTLIDSGIAASKEVEKYLEARALRSPSNSIGEGEFFVSDLPNKFREVAELFLGKKIKNLQKIDLESIIQ